MADVIAPTPTEPTPAEPPGGGTGDLARRRFFVGGAALAGAAVAGVAAPGPASAGHNTSIAYDTQTVMHLDVTNTTAGSTRVSSDVSGTAAFVALNNYPVGIPRPDGMLGRRTSYTTSNCAGVAGTCESDTGGLGVLGSAKSATGTGVYGFAGSVVPSTVAPAGTGVYGSGPTTGVVAVARDAGGTGVHATATDGVAVRGVATGGLAAHFEGTTRVDGALQATTATVDRVATKTLRLTEASGKAKTTRRTRILTVSGVPVAGTSLVVATLQRPRRGLFVAAAQPVPARDQIKIHFNKVAPKGTVVGWVVVN
jgi:hypothetical protein